MSCWFRKFYLSNVRIATFPHFEFSAFLSIAYVNECIDSLCVFQKHKIENENVWLISVFIFIRRGEIIWGEISIKTYKKAIFVIHTYRSCKIYIIYQIYRRHPLRNTNIQSWFGVWHCCCFAYEKKELCIVYTNGLPHCSRESVLFVINIVYVSFQNIGLSLVSIVTFEECFRNDLLIATDSI